jgi:hypothetical protein
LLQRALTCGVCVVRQGWSKKDGQIITDAFGRPTPNPDMYPSSANGAGMRPLADALAAKGLRLGLWMMRGVPRSAAAARLPIFGSTTNSTALDAVRYDKNCFWSTSCHGSNYPSTAADEYYKSVASMLKAWDVTYVKVCAHTRVTVMRFRVRASVLTLWLPPQADCFFPNMPASQLQPVGYFDDDIVGFGTAMRDAGVTVSFSPGISVTPANGTFLARSGYAVSYRVSEDMCVRPLLACCVSCYCVMRASRLPRR